MAKSPLELVQTVSNRSNNELISFGEDLFKRARSDRYKFERQWYVNLSFYFGKQWVQLAPSVLGSGGWGRLWEPPAPSWRVRLVANKVKAITRTELAKITKEKPQGYVVPTTTDDKDLAAARAGEAIFEHLWRKKTMNKVIRRAQFWTVLCGNGFVKDWFDPKKPDDSDMMGDICFEPLSPFHLVVPDLQEEEIENQPYIIHTMGKDPEWIFDRYGKRIPPDANAGPGLLEQGFLSALGIVPSKKTHVLVKELWLKPCGKYLDGLMLTWAGDTVLAMNEGWPYQYKDYCFTKFDHIPTGRFYSDSTIVDVIPLQREYNRTRSQIIESKNRMSKPQLLAYRGSVNANMITSEPGLVIFVTPGYQMPTPLPLQSLPSYVIEELNRIQQDMDDISSQHEISRGRTPPGVTAATAISYLQEEDDSKLAYTITSLEEGVEKIGKHMLSHVDEFWNAERQIQVVGDNGAIEAFVFSNADIAGNTDFRIESGSATPRSRAAKQAFITELIKMQVITPDQGLKYLEMAETSKLYQEQQESARQVQRENLRMAMAEPPQPDPMAMMMGQPPPQIEPLQINPFDDDLTHIVEHNRFCRKQEFERLAPEIQQAIVMHIELHKQRLGFTQFGVPMQVGDPRLPKPERMIPGQQYQVSPPPGMPTGPGPVGEQGGGPPQGPVT